MDFQEELRKVSKAAGCQLARNGEEHAKIIVDEFGLKQSEVASVAGKMDKTRVMRMFVETEKQYGVDWLKFKQVKVTKVKAVYGVVTRGENQGRCLRQREE